MTRPEGAPGVAPRARTRGVLPLALPAVLAALLAAMALLPSIRDTRACVWSFLGAAACLGAWNLWLCLGGAARHRQLSLGVTLRPSHYVQACAQGSVFLYWGWYWREIYAAAPLIAGQLVFAYAFDMLLTWSRRDTYSLGFAPFPVIFSINLFLRFRDEWFYLQFLLVAIGFAAKELIRWEKDGRRVHIFNPSSFPLGLFSLVLILTGTSGMTWGQEIATTLNLPPHIYLWIFLIGLPGQLLFGVVTMTMSAVVTMYAFGVLYVAQFGSYYFVDSYIPIAVFLGMHLLFTDPSTAPRSELGRVLFGVCYALGVIVLYDVLGRFGQPTFYDKLLAVPLLNLTIQGIDRAVRSGALRRFDLAALAPRLEGRSRHLAFVGVWSVVFVALSGAKAVGDTHRGEWVPFQQQVCETGSGSSCRQFAVLVSGYCRAGSGWACNEYGILVQPAIRPDVAARAFDRACALGFSTGCDNLKDGARASHAPPTEADYRIVLRGKKRRLPDLTPVELYQRACAQGFADGCRRACELGDGESCPTGTP